MNCKKFKTHVRCNYYGAITLLQILANVITLYEQIIHYAQLKCCWRIWQKYLHVHLTHRI